MKLMAFFLSLMLPFILKGQTNIRGQLRDINGLPIIGAKVSIQNQTGYILSDTIRGYNIEIKQTPAILNIYHQGYYKIEYLIDTRHTSGNPVNFTLLQNSKILSSVTVFSEPVIMVSKFQNANIIDYCFQNNNILVILKLKSNYFIRSITPFGKILNEKELPNKPTYILKDCQGNLYLDSKDQIFNIVELEETFSLTKVILKDMDCRCETSSHYFFELYNHNQQSIIYYSYNKKNYKREFIVEISDQVSIEQNNYIQNKIDTNPGSIMVAELYEGGPPSKNIDNARRKLQDQLYKEIILEVPIYNPIFELNDSIYIFNHIEKLILIHDKNGTPIRKVNTSYSGNKEWVPVILIDESRGKFYTLHNNGYYVISEINISNGELTNTYVLKEHTFPKTIKVNNGYVYYLDHINLTSSFYKLYKQRL